MALPQAPLPAADVCRVSMVQLIGQSPLPPILVTLGLQYLTDLMRKQDLLVLFA